MNKGYQVLRFWNQDVLNDIDSVLGNIIQFLEEKANNESSIN
ncbi:MAG: DUF559 domain-containing protein [Anaerolineales bacterium]|nr:DUF559 domain-containing protein [Chloroflexota bacterium]MBL6982657.1 DUF559 domain-containing protein [Anaerolineales bacterium]